MGVAKGRFASAFRGTDAFADRNRKELRDFFDRAKWYPWRYNEIVGYIRLVTRRSEIVGELFLRDAKRLAGRPTARFLYKGDLFLVYVRPEWTNAQILQQIHEELIAFLRSDRTLRRRVLDTEVLLSIGPFVDWRGLVDAAEQNLGST
jgi:GNAT superfamily N-acetyltransferase